MQKNTQPRLGVFLAFILLLSGCSHTPQTRAVLQQSELPRQVELQQVPFFPQTEYQCGPAALATVFNYRGIDISPDALTSQVYVPERRGSLQLEMTAAVRRQGLVAYPLTADLHSLFNEVAAGNPVLVMQNLGYNWMPFWHYAVVVGFDLDAQQVILRSAETERMLTALPTFERTWARSDHWALVIIAPDQLPATATEVNWLRSAYDLQQTGQQQAAVTAYQTALQQWPDSSSTVIAWSNMLYEQGDYPQAEQLLADSLQRNPMQANLWNNRAHVLQALQCNAAARAAAGCAINLAPDNANAQSTWQTMQALEASRSLQLCPAIRCPQ